MTSNAAVNPGSLVLFDAVHIPFGVRRASSFVPTTTHARFSVPSGLPFSYLGMIVGFLIILPHLL